jgi:CHASE1-domain containing sensor protein
MSNHRQILLGGAGLFEASESVSREDWRHYVQRLDLETNYPGIQGVGFSQIIRPGQLAEFEAAMRSEGFADFSVRPPGSRDLYTSILFLEPFSGRNLAFRF